MLLNTLIYRMYGNNTNRYSENINSIYDKLSREQPFVKSIINYEGDLWGETLKKYDGVNRRFVYSVTCDDDSKYIDGDSPVMPLCLAIEQLGNKFTRAEWNCSYEPSKEFNHRWWGWIEYDKSDLVELYVDYDGKKNYNYLRGVQYASLMAYHPNFEFVLNNSNGDVLFRSVNGKTDYTAWSMEGVDKEKVYDKVYSTVVSLVDNGNYQQAYDYLINNWIVYDGSLDYKDLYDYYWYAYALLEHTQDNLMAWTDIDHISKISAGFKDADTKLAGIRNAKNSIMGEWRYRNAYGDIYTLSISNDGSSSVIDGYSYYFYTSSIYLAHDLGWVTKDGAIKYAFSKECEQTKNMYGSNDTFIVPNGKTLNLKYTGHNSKYACGTYIKVENE